jgi:hypothetical protein
MVCISCTYFSRADFKSPSEKKMAAVPRKKKPGDDART